MTRNAAGILAGRTALVLGLDDIGAGIARRFAREGATLALLHPEDPSLTATLASELNAVAIPAANAKAFDADSIEAQVYNVVRQAGRLDVVVCNLLPPSNACLLTDLGDSSVDDAFLRVRATLAAMRAALPALRSSGRGRIVIVGHRYGESVSEALGIYNAVAWSLVGLARTAAVEWGQYQIATNVLVPLARTAEFEAARTKRPAIVDRLVDQLPLRRVGDLIEDVGGAAALLASEAMGWVNGEVIHADGGQHVAGPVLNPVRFAT